MTHEPLRFRARTQTGLSQGRTLGFPTVNFVLEDVPKALAEGIYACRVTVAGMQYGGALHFGPRPAVHAGPSCEIHLLDVVLPSLPPQADVEIVAKIREVQDFPTPADLAARIGEDVRVTREILARRSEN